MQCEPDVIPDRLTVQAWWWATLMLNSYTSNLKYDTENIKKIIRKMQIDGIESKSKINNRLFK